MVAAVFLGGKVVDSGSRLVIMAERGAPSVIIVNGMHYAHEGFDTAFRQMEQDRLWQILRLEEFNYMTELTRPGWLLVARKL